MVNKKITRLLFFFTLALWVSQHAFAQSKIHVVIDSLLKQLPKHKNDTSRVRLLYLLCDKYQHINPDSGFYYGGLGMDLAEDLRWKVGVGLMNLGIGENSMTQSFTDAALGNFQKAWNIFRETDNKPGIAQAGEALGACYMVLGNYGKSLEHFNAAMEEYRQIGDLHGIARCYGNIGMVYLNPNNAPNKTNTSKALAAVEKALNMVSTRGNTIEMADIKFKLGSVYKYMREYGRTLKYYQEAYDIIASTDRDNDIAVAIHNLGSVAALLEKYDEALADFKKAAILFQKVGNRSGVARGCLNSGYTLSLKSQDSALGLSLIDKENLLQQAKTVTEQAIAISRDIKSDQLIQLGYRNLAHFDGLLGDFRAAYEEHVSFFDYYSRFFGASNVREYADAVKDIEFQKERDSMLLHQVLIETQLREQTLLAKQEQQQSELDSQKLVLARSERNFQQLKLQKAQVDLKTQKNENELKEKELSRKKSQQLLYLAGIVLLSVFIGIIFRGLRVQKRLNKTIGTLVTEQEKIIEQRTQALSATNTKLRRLISFNAHQVREPLTRITGALGLHREMDQDEFYKDYMPLLEKAANDLDAAVKEVLAKAQER